MVMIKHKPQQTHACNARQMIAIHSFECSNSRGLLKRVRRDEQLSPGWHTTSSSRFDATCGLLDL